MPANRDFEEEGDNLHQETTEKTPGVYVRTNEREPQELDMLWSGSRNYVKEERSPVVFFGAGLLLGIILTSAVFILFINKPQIKMGENKLTTPITDESGLMNNNNTNGSTAKTETSAKAGGRTYTVKSGDTLGHIAEKEYGNSGPEMVDKIQRANNLKNPNDIHEGQELVIPPSNY
jgi:hypothetical protein